MEANRLAIAQALHAGLLRKLREALVQALDEKRKVAILVDNLDKAWDKQSDIENLSEFLLGLLSAVTRVSGDFKNVGMQRRTLNVSLAVFVRSDIFYKVMNIAREPDKIVHSRITWSDPELLIRLVEERFASSLGIPPHEAWAKYFCPTVREMPTKTYFASRILKRPRDLLFFVKAAISTAVNRRHAMVEEKDILDAEKQYSQFAVDSILVENGISIKELEHIIYEFVGATPTLPAAEVFKILRRVGIPEENTRYVMNHLCVLTFLGVEVNAGEFRFADDYSEFQKNSVLAQKLAERRAKELRYKINPAFWSFLEIADETFLEMN